MSLPKPAHTYSLIVALHPPAPTTLNSSEEEQNDIEGDWRLGEINVDWVDFTREKSIDQPITSVDKMPRNQSPGTSARKKNTASSSRYVPGSSPKPSPSTATSHKRGSSPTTNLDPNELSLQPLLAHYPNPAHGPGPNPLDSSFASGISELGRGVVHLFKHPPPSHLIASIDSHPIGEGSKSRISTSKDQLDLTGEKAEGEDGSLIAILAVPAWMRPSDFIEFIGGWSNCLEGVRMIREATTPNRSIVLLKFRDPLQASDFSMIFTGKAFSTLDPRETCHPIRIHHLILHKFDNPPSSRNPTSTKSSTIAIPAFPPSVYSSRARELPELLKGVGSSKNIFELPSCPVCLERLDSTVTGLVTLPCAHTFDCDCLRKWGDSRCPVCRLSHLLLSSAQTHSSPTALNGNGLKGSARGRGRDSPDEITRLTKCSMCNSTENNWICVVCGTVGCGRYEPGKGHARRHWEESGHVLAMELETQRVWDYKGDNYVHRLIQSRSDGKLVELPSASSLVTSSIPRPLPLGASDSRPNSTTHTPERQPYSAHNHNQPPSGGRGSTSSSNDAGPSSGDVEKMSTIESITLEYSYLLSSQLESMRHHYESEQSTLLDRLSRIEDSNRATELRLRELENVERTKENLETRLNKSMEIVRTLQKDLNVEKTMSNGLITKIKNLEMNLEKSKEQLKNKEDEVMGMEETVKDLMFTLEAGMKLKEMGHEGGQDGDLMIVPGTTPASKGKKKSKR